MRDKFVSVAVFVLVLWPAVALADNSDYPPSPSPTRSIMPPGLAPTGAPQSATTGTVWFLLLAGMGLLTLYIVRKRSRP